MKLSQIPRSWSLNDLAFALEREEADDREMAEQEAIDNRAAVKRDETRFGVWGRCEDPFILPGQNEQAF